MTKRFTSDTYVEYVLYFSEVGTVSMIRTVFSFNYSETKKKFITEWLESARLPKVSFPFGIVCLF